MPLDTDLLYAQQNAMVGLAKFCAAVLGATTIVNGFTCVPTAPASLNVLLTAGEVYQLEPLEATAWAALAADTTDIILKQGIQLQSVQFPLTPPATNGYSQVFLIEVQYQDLDTGLEVLPYFNSTMPGSPFMGPGNDGQPQDTVRQGIVAAQVKAGIAAPSGTQLAPSADPGWTGLFTVTVANGATTITAGNIATVLNAPFIPVTLPNVPAGVQANLWSYAVDTGTASALVISPTPAPAAYGSGGMGFWVKAANAPTGATTINVMGRLGSLLGSVGVVHSDGSPITANEWTPGAILGLLYDGSHFQLQISHPISSDLIDSAVTFTVHGAGANFSDLNAAFEYLSKFKITHNGYVTLQCAAGTWNYGSTMLFCDHPQNHRIQILGATMLGAVDTTSGSYGGGTTACMTYLRSKFATELHFTGGAGIEVNGMQLGAMDALLITGDNSTGPISDGQGLAFTCNGYSSNQFLRGPTRTSGLAVCQFNYGLTIIAGGAMTMPWSGPLILIGNNIFGMTANARSGGTIIGNIIGAGNGNTDVNVGQESMLWLQGTIYAGLSPAINTVGNNNAIIVS